MRENKVLWENPSLMFRQEYEATSGTNARRSRGVLRPGHERARSAQHRVRAHDRQRDPGGVLIAPCLIATARRRSAQADRSPATTGSPIYLLQGEDDVEKSALAAEFAELVEEGLRAFNVERIHAGDMTTGDRLADGVGSIVAAARTLPMMAPRRVVTVLQAETLLAPKRESEAATRALEQLEALFKAPEPQTTLVLVATRARQAQPACTSCC